MTRMKWNVLHAFAALGLASAPGFANPILVNNSSFESLPSAGLPTACFGTGCSFSLASAANTISGWTSVGEVGQIEFGTSAVNPYFSSVSDGFTSAFSRGGSLSQTVGATIAAGITYTLMVDIGWRLDKDFDGTADLVIGSGATAKTVVATGLTPTRGTFSTYTATYTGLAGDAGKSITIELWSSGLQGNFDDVLLSDSVPEPTSFLLMGSALWGLAAIGRRRQKS